MIAKPMKRKPKKAIVGPITMRRAENMSSLNEFQSVAPPAIRAKPSTIITPAIIIRIKFFLISGICSGVSFIREVSPAF